MTEDEGAQLLRMLARAVVELSEATRDGVISLPYPHAVQRVLDRVVAVCLDREEPPPHSVPELVAWCAQRPCERWPFPVPAGLLRSGSLLVEPASRMPTRTCLELSSGGPGESPEQEALGLFRRLDEAAGAGPGRSQQVRDFIIDHPIVRRDFPLGRAADMAMWRWVGNVYEPVPLAYVVDRKVPTCPTCGLLASTESGRLTWCETELCPRGTAPVMFRREAVLVLCAPLRLFLALPGSTERRIREELSLAGIGVGPADLEGAYELDRLVCGKRALRVLDRVQPALLAAAVHRWPGSLVVVPQLLVDRFASYRTAFMDALPADADVTLLPENELTSLVGGTRKDSRHA
jgi:hypothetical protein